jgi:hypothetical protein
MQWLESKCDQMQKELTHLKTELNALKAQMKKSETVKTKAVRKKCRSSSGSKPLKKPFETPSDCLVPRCILCKHFPRSGPKNNFCLHCLKTPLSSRRCISINETGKNSGKQCGYPPVEGRQMCQKHLEDFIDVTKSDNTDGESSEDDDENESIVVTDHSSDGSLSDSEEEYSDNESSSSDSEDDRPLKRQRR